jgi:hypothetical protein
VKTIGCCIRSYSGDQDGVLRTNEKIQHNCAVSLGPGARSSKYSPFSSLASFGIKHWNSSLARHRFASSIIIAYREVEYRSYPAMASGGRHGSPVPTDFFGWIPLLEQTRMPSPQPLSDSNEVELRTTGRIIQGPPPWNTESPICGRLNFSESESSQWDTPSLVPELGVSSHTNTFL